jgi:hypothetical protein
MLILLNYDANEFLVSFMYNFLLEQCCG